MLKDGVWASTRKPCTLGVTVPAYAMLLYWFGLQLLGAHVSAEAGGVAFAAHTVGLVAVALLVTLSKNPDLLARRETPLRCHASPGRGLI